MSENSGTINIYIPLNMCDEECIDEVIRKCLVVMESCTMTNCVKYIHINNDISSEKCRSITFYGRVYWFWETVKKELIKLCVNLGLNELYVETDNKTNKITKDDILRYIKEKTS